MSLPPVIWKPTNKFWERGRHPVRAFVMHHIVGSLASADAVFAPSGTKLASAHFGIGHINGRLEIHQYVDLSDAAWTNGDVRDPTAKVVLANPGVNPNLYSVTFEHEDGSYAGRGIVQPDTWAASMELTLLLASGVASAIRAAGIKVRTDATVAQMAAVPKTADGYIDHNAISGPNKPYCWRRWLDDPGYVEGSPSRRDQLLKVLNAGVLPDTTMGADMPQIVKWEPGAATIGGGASIASAPSWAVSALMFKVAASGSGANTFIGWVKGELYDGVDLWGVFWQPTHARWAYTHKVNVLSVKPLVGETVTVEKIVEVPTGITQAQLNDAVLRASAAGKIAGATTEKSRLRTLLGI